MRGYIYAVYETRSQKELCLGVWETMDALSKSLGMSIKRAWSLFYRGLHGRKRCTADYDIRRIALEGE